MLIMNFAPIKMCVPVERSNGLDSEVSAHFGRAPYHVVVDLITGEVTTIQKENECSDSHGHCMPVDLLIKNNVRVVACKGIGRGAASRLMSNKIAVFATQANKVADVIKAYEKDTLSPIKESNLCSGHHTH